MILFIANLDGLHERPQPTGLAERFDVRHREIGRGRAAKVDIDHVRDVEGRLACGKCRILCKVGPGDAVAAAQWHWASIDKAARVRRAAANA